MLEVVDVFTHKYGKPKRRSSAAIVAVVMSEQHPDRIDGAIGQCSPTGFTPQYNAKLDGAFAAKRLLGVDLPIVNLPTNQQDFNTLLQPGTSVSLQRSRRLPARQMQPTWLEADGEGALQLLEEQAPAHAALLHLHAESAT